MDGRTDGNASKTEYPPVSLRSLGRYNNISPLKPFTYDSVLVQTLSTDHYYIKLVAYN